MLTKGCVIVPRECIHCCKSEQICQALVAQVVDTVLAAYEVKNTKEAITGLAEPIIRQNFGGISLNKILHDKDILNEKITGIYLTLDIKKLISMQSCTKCKKRAEILKSEGKRQSSIIIADGARCYPVVSYAK